MELIRFMDCNRPGVVYVGTRADMQSFADEGCCPCEVSGVIEDEDGVWPERHLHRPLVSGG